MVHIPPSVAESQMSRAIEAVGFKLIDQGKVRRMYTIPGRGNAKRQLVVATDRVSIFDFVLPVFVPQKGEALTALTDYWLMQILADFPSHLVPSKSFPDRNAVFDLNERYPEIPIERSLVVQKLQMLPFELVFRHHLGGSVWQQYQETGAVWERKLGPGLPKWSFLEEPLFTPATKAQTGHDINISPEDFLGAAGERGKAALAMCLAAYKRAYDHAKSRGIIILDTKFEVGCTDNGTVLIADEVLTPDSSRFTTEIDFLTAIATGRDPVFYDKQPVRDWGAAIKTQWGVGLNRLNPNNPKHLQFVDSLHVPDEVVGHTAERYLEIVEMLTDWSLHDYPGFEMPVQ